MALSSSRLINAQTDQKEQDTGYHNLQRARTDAAAKNGYNSTATRNAMANLFHTNSGGKMPYDWQLDIAEAFILGLDCVLIAGTGMGKTIPFMLPLLLPQYATSTIPVISPLRSLQRDQVCSILICFHMIPIM